MTLNTLNLAISGLLWLASALCMAYIGYVVCFDNVATALPLIGHMLTRPSPYERVAPILILVVFTWVLIDLTLRARRVWQQHSAVALVRSSLDNQDMNAVAGFPRTPSSPRAFRRAAIIADNYFEDRRNLPEILPTAASLDGSVLANGFAWLHVYAWSLPVLGFIGTAVGMASSILGFSQALSEATSIDVGTMAIKLSTLVIPGLSTAFETTVLALTASLITYMCTSALEKSDQEALEKLDYMCLEVLARMPPAETAEHADSQRILQEISDNLSSVAATHTLISDVVEEFRGSAELVKNAASALERASHELHASITMPYNVTITRGTPPYGTPPYSVSVKPSDRA
jgi:biopolymer transport protein ExbB/TolQ